MSVKGLVMRAVTITAIIFAMMISGNGRCLAEKGIINLDHLRIDHAQRQVVIDARVVQQSVMLELVLCRRGIREHESLLATEAVPSHVHAALLSLGLMEGIPGRYVHEIAGVEAVYVPPRGPELEITLRWKSPDGTQMSASPGEWMVPAGENELAAPDRWVFVGSEVMPDGSYLADSEGHVISVANIHSAVVDVPFESSNDNAILEFAGNPKTIPPIGTAVEVVISPVKGAEDSPYGRAVVEVDRFGRYWIEGKEYDSEKLMDWADDFSSLRPEGLVVVRALPGALAYDLELVSQCLRIGGAYYMDEQRLLPGGDILPRTDADARRLMSTWTRRLSPSGSVFNPLMDAQTHLNQIEATQADLDRHRQLLDEYARQLRQLIDEFKQAQDQQATDQ